MTSRPIVLVISSHVARGSVGNRALVFPLERLGFEVWAVPTILLPHHPGHGPGTRIVPPDQDFAGLTEDLAKSDRASQIVGIISGYLASPAQAVAVAKLVDTVKRVRPDVLYLCDPVIGDGEPDQPGRLYVPEPVARAVRDSLLPLADLATPNAFECFWLSGRAELNGDLPTLARYLPPPTVLVTSAPALMRGHHGNLLVEAQSTTLIENRSVTTPVKGTGDLLAALLLARRLQGQSWIKAAESAVASVFEVVAGSAKAGADELMLSAFQHAMVSPASSVNVRALQSGTPERPA